MVDPFRRRPVLQNPNDLVPSPTPRTATDGRWRGRVVTRAMDGSPECMGLCACGTQAPGFV